MRIFTTLLLVLTLQHSFAQITITQADLPEVGDTYVTSTALDPGIDYATTGANQTWDYSYLTELTQNIDTIFPVDFTPNAYQFFFDNANLFPDHVADYAARGQELDLAGQFTLTNVFNFTRQDSDATRNVGFGANINGIPASIRNDSIDVIYNLPLNFGDATSNYFEFGLSVPTIGYYGGQGTRINEVDGWGTLITPYGTFDALRIRSEIQQDDSIYVDLVGFGFNIPRNRVEYKWLGVDGGIPLLQITTNVSFLGETVQSIVYQDSARNGLGVDEHQLLDWEIYPNPTSSNITVQGSGLTQDQVLHVLDLSGRLVKTIPVSGSVTIDVSFLAEGVYTLVLESQEGRGVRRLVVQH